MFTWLALHCPLVITEWMNAFYEVKPTNTNMTSEYDFKSTVKIVGLQMSHKVEKRSVPPPIYPVFVFCDLITLNQHLNVSFLTLL